MIAVPLNDKKQVDRCTQVLINIYITPPDYRVLPHKKETLVSQEEPTSPSTGGPQPILLIPDSKEVSQEQVSRTVQLQLSVQKPLVGVAVKTSPSE